jgi:hypothetical protein
MSDWLGRNSSHLRSQDLKRYIAANDLRLLAAAIEARVRGDQQQLKAILDYSNTLTSFTFRDRLSQVRTRPRLYYFCKHLYWKFRKQFRSTNKA